LTSTRSYTQVYTGKIVDVYKTGISFAHVFFQSDQSKGSTSNEIGEFRIFVSDFNQLDTLVISVLGYETLFVAYSEIDDYNNVFELNSSSIFLNVITIKSDSYFRSIIKEAIVRIPKNYPVEDHLQKAYYLNYTISDSSYSEMIEADFQLVTNGYQKGELKERVYLNQLRKTKDNRNLPDRLKIERNGIYNTLNKNKVHRRTLSWLGGYKVLRTINEFKNSIDDIDHLEFHKQSIQDGDTIITIKFPDPIFQSSEFASKVYTLLSINLTDKAIVKIVFGDAWSENRDFDEVVYRKINNRYYPAYIRSVTNYEFNQKRNKHYSAHCILFYDVVTGKDKIKSEKVGKKIKREEDLRQVKIKSDKEFWEEYIYGNQLSASALVRSKFGFKS